MSRYNEVYYRIYNNFERFRYATDSGDNLYSWKFYGDKQIAIKTYYNCRNEYDYETIYIDAKYLETNESFNKWLDDECDKRKNKEKREEEIENKCKEEEERALYEELKKKYK